MCVTSSASWMLQSPGATALSTGIVAFVDGWLSCTLVVVGLWPQVPAKRPWLAKWLLIRACP